MRQVAALITTDVTGDDGLLDQDASLKLDSVLRGDGFAAVRAAKGFQKVIRSITQAGKSWTYSIRIVFASSPDYQQFRASLEEPFVKSLEVCECDRYS